MSFRSFIQLFGFLLVINNSFIYAALDQKDGVFQDQSSDSIDYANIECRVCTGAIKPFLQTIIDDLNMLQTCCDQVGIQLDVIESKIDNIHVVASADLTPVISQLDVCCSTIDSELGVIDSKIDNIHVVASADLTPVLSSLDVCCSTIDNELSVIESKIDNIHVVASADLTPVISKLDVCCSTIDSELSVVESQNTGIRSVVDQIDSKIDNISVPSADITPVMSKLDVCCSTIDSELSVVESQNTGIRSVVDQIDSKIDNISVPSADITPVMSKLDVCCSTIDSELSVVESQNTGIRSVVDQIDSKIDNINVPSADITPVMSKLDVCCSTIDSELSVVESQNTGIRSVVDQIDSKIDNINVPSADITPIISKLDVCCSTLDSELGVVNSNLEVIEGQNTNLRSVADQIDSKIDVVNAPVLSALDVCCSTIDSELSVVESQNTGIRSVVDQIDSKIDNINVPSADITPVLSKLDVCCSTIDSELSVVESQNTGIRSVVDEIDSKIDLPSACAGRAITSNGFIPATAPVMITVPTVITDPGYYCLAQDITYDESLHEPFLSAIEINADNVVLDLNNHTIIVADTDVDVDSKGITVDSGHFNVIIKNGSIVSDGTGLYGIDIAYVSSINFVANVQILDVSISGFTGNGINAKGVNTLTIQNCILRTMTDSGNGNGIYVNACPATSITNCLAEACDNGFTVTATIGSPSPSDSGVVLNECVAHFNTGQGFRDTMPGWRTVVQYCKAIENGSYGFNTVDTTNKYYIGNTGIHNGATPAQDPDTNFNNLNPATGVPFPYTGEPPFYWIVTPANISTPTDNVTIP